MPSMPPEPAHSTEDRRNPPITTADVLVACRELAAAGEPVTRRSVREKLGRGSMTTIHNGVREYENQQTPSLPPVELTREDHQIITELGARALTIAVERVQHIHGEREALLLASAEAAESRANDAIAAAEARIEEAQQQALIAEDARQAAIAEKDKATASAAAAAERALRTEGQMEQLASRNAALTARLHDIEQELAVSKTRIELEIVGRRQAESELATATSTLAALRETQQAQAQAQAQTLAQIREALAAEQALRIEVTHQRDSSLAALEKQQHELAALTTALNRMEATITSQEASIRQLSLDLASERNRVTQLTLIASSTEQHAAALRSLEETIAALASRTEKHPPKEASQNQQDQ